MGNKLTDKLDAEIAELERLQYPQEAEGKPGDPVVAGQSAPEADPLTPESVPTTIDPLAPQSQTEQPSQKKERVSWKKRYINLKQYHDTSRQQDRLQISQLLTQVTELQRELIDVKTKYAASVASVQPSISDLATPEELNVLGEEGVSSIDKLTRKAIESATAPLQEELANLQAQRLNDQQSKANNMAQESYNHFLTNLANLVPDYDVLDADPKFEQFLLQPDPSSGRIKKELFKQAEANGDVGRVAYFFQEFKKVVNPNQQKLAQAVTPVGSQSSPLDNQGGPHSEGPQLMSMAQYTRFMDDVTKGRFKGNLKEQQTLEAQFDSAISDGRMVP